MVQAEVRNAKKSIDYAGMSGTNNSLCELHNTRAFFALLLFGKDQVSIGRNCSNFKLAPFCTYY